MRIRAAILVASLVVLILFGVSSYSIWRLWRAPIWNPLALASVHDLIQTMPSVLGSPKAQYYSSGPMGSECGGGFFVMEEAVAGNIEKEGLSFFAGATKGRAYDGHNGSTSRYLYAPWQETPISANWNQEGTYTKGFQCMKPRREIFDAIRKAIAEPGGYFTSRFNAQILVLPETRLILLTFSY